MAKRPARRRGKAKTSRALARREPAVPAVTAPREIAGRPLRGTPLRDEDVRAGRIALEEWTPSLVYRWDAGVAIGRFLEGLKAGTIIGVRCHSCGRTVTPPRAFCEWDFTPMDEWVELPDTGTINTFSICTVTWDMKPLEVPQVPAVVEIDGTSPRVGFLHLIGGVRGRTVETMRRELRLGLAVRAIWKPESQRIGAITDILYFTPVS